MYSFGSTFFPTQQDPPHWSFASRTGWLVGWLVGWPISVHQETPRFVALEHRPTQKKANKNAREISFPKHVFFSGRLLMLRFWGKRQTKKKVGPLRRTQLEFSSHQICLATEVSDLTFLLYTKKGITSCGIPPNGGWSKGSRNPLSQMPKKHPSRADRSKWSDMGGPEINGQKYMSFTGGKYHPEISGVISPYWNNWFWRHTLVICPAFFCGMYTPPLGMWGFQPRCGRRKFQGLKVHMSLFFVCYRRFKFTPLKTRKSPKWPGSSNDHAAWYLSNPQVYYAKFDIFNFTEV